MKSTLLLITSTLFISGSFAEFDLSDQPDYDSDIATSATFWAIYDDLEEFPDFYISEVDETLYNSASSLTDQLYDATSTEDVGEITSSLSEVLISLYEELPSSDYTSIQETITSSYISLYSEQYGSEPTITGVWATDTYYDDDYYETAISDDDYYETAISDDDYYETAIPDDDYYETAIPDDDYYETAIPDDDYYETAIPEDDYYETAIPEDDYYDNFYYTAYATTVTIFTSHYPTAASTVTVYRCPSSSSFGGDGSSGGVGLAFDPSSQETTAVSGTSRVSSGVSSLTAASSTTVFSDSSSYSTAVTGTTGVYETYYALAQCAALNDDVNGYSDDYDSFLSTYTDKVYVTSFLNAYSEYWNQTIPATYNEICVDTLTSYISALPWKGRILEIAKSVYDDIEEYITSDIVIGYTTIPAPAPAPGATASA